MEGIDDIVRVIESIETDIETKMLWLKFDSENNLEALFTPNLENIGFAKVDSTITITLKNPSFRDFFNDWVTRFIDKIEVNDSSEILIKKFNNEIKAIVLLGQKEKKMSVNAAKGLYAEFLVLKQYLDEGQYTQAEVLQGWHRPAPANHDFDYEDFSLEVKATSRDSTTIKITSEHQLMAIEDKPLHLHLYRIDTVKKSNEDSLGELYLIIKKQLETGLVNVFEMKCAEDEFCEYLGPENMPLDYKFLIIEDFLFGVDQGLFPRIRKEILDVGLSKVSYNLDISSFESFKIP
tara:strand:+ start:5523 stop:6398 length:876 start_codon:yes stop_codon:yes gene_type:complete